MKTTFIYLLRDPRTKEPKYVGKTNNPKKRVWDHMSVKQPNHKMRTLVKELRELGLKPELEVLEECLVENWGEREMYWIKKFRDEGVSLLNVFAGGNGCGDHAEIVCQLMKIVQNRPERKALQSEVGRRTMSNPETKLKIAAAKRKWFDDPENRKAHSDRMKKWRCTPEFKLKHNAQIRLRQSKICYQICPTSNIIIAEYESATVASKTFGINWSCLWKALKQGKIKKGFKWSYEKPTP